MTPAWLCVNTTWTHRTSYPGPTSVQQNPNVPSVCLRYVDYTHLLLFTAHWGSHFNCISSEMAEVRRDAVPFLPTFKPKLQQGFQATAATSKLWAQGSARWGTSSSSCKQPQLLLIPRRIHPHLAACHQLTSDHILTLANTAVPGSKHAGKESSGAKRFIRHRTAPTHLPSPVLCWHVELMLNYCEWFINL